MTDPAIEREALTLFEAMLDVPEGDRDVWLAIRCADRPALLARISAMRAADRIADLRTGAANEGLDDEIPPERIGAYRIAERIGRGGMGSVYRGERVAGDFTHIVAIKIIKPGLLSDRLIERFQRERQILAQLSHPNIAQLHDGGETIGGSPYIIMEHVDGLPLLTWAEEQALDMSARRRLFGDVCGAVAFAHRSLVVHRDLTPSNILVTREGVAKLIDFGIARPADTDATPSRTSRSSVASLSLTPGYAAPERMTSAAVTTASDVYSLGRLLEKLIPPASTDRELKAIVARATAAAPEDRYPTAEALSEDVAALGAGLPVAAMAGGRWYAARKFVGRHVMGVMAVTAATILLIGALGLTLRANAGAETARAEAERRFEQTRSIAGTMLFDVYDEISKAPGSTVARAKLAQTGLRYLEALAADPAAPRDVRVEAGRGFTRLAQVTGGGQSATLGRYKDAGALLARADTILASLHTRFPGDAAVTRAYGQLLLEQAGGALYNDSDVPLARAKAARAERLLRPLARKDAEAARAYAVSLQALGDSHSWADAYPAAQHDYERALAFIAALPIAIRDDAKVMSAQSAILRLLAEAYHKQKLTEPARLTLDRAVAVNRKLVAAVPDDPARARKLAISLRYRAVVHRTNERDAAARESGAEALAVARRLRTRDPNDAGALQMVAATGEVQAQVLADAGRYAESYSVGDEVEAAYRRLAQLAGNAPGAIRSVATSLSVIGTNHYNGGDYPGACRSWARSLAVFEGLARRGALIQTDRENGLTEVLGFIRDGCNPPREMATKRTGQAL